MIGDSDSNRSEGQGGRREALSAKEVRSKGTTIGTRTGSEAAMRAMSVLGSAKSNRHRKTHRVEPDGTGRKFMHLTRGGFFGESQRGVSRGHSSEESRRKAEGAKGRRTNERAQERPAPRREARRTAKRRGRCNCGSHPGRRTGEAGMECPATKERAGRVTDRAAGATRQCSMRETRRRQRWQQCWCRRTCKWPGCR